MYSKKRIVRKFIRLETAKHLRIDFIPYVMGWKGMDIRVSLKQALKSLEDRREQLQPIMDNVSKEIKEYGSVKTLLQWQLRSKNLWVRLMNNIKFRAEEIDLKEIIYR